jgi:hypothetical protein
MLDQAWDQYIGWATRARELQERSRHWSWIGLAAAVGAAVAGTLASQLGAQSRVFAGISTAAALISAGSAWFGREAIVAENEKKWVKARSLAETIKSECFRYAAKLAPYDGADADTLFAARLGDATAAVVNGTSLAQAPHGSSKSPRPAIGMTREWYLQNRIKDQQIFFQGKLERSVKILRRLQIFSFVMMGLAALIGALATLNYVQFAAWTGVVTTVAASVTAMGLAERNKALAETAAGMANLLGNLLLTGTAGTIPMGELVQQGEQLLAAEHSRWIAILGKTGAVAQPQPPAAG